MSSQILRPAKNNVHKPEWLIQGTWGQRKLEPMSKIDLYGLLHIELVRDGVLPEDSSAPSNRHHDHVTGAIRHSSWIENRWILDETGLYGKSPFGI